MSNNEASGNESDGAECPTCGKVLDTERGRSIHHAHAHGEKLRETLTCPVCDVEFEVKWSHRERRNCCSRECRNEYRSGLEELQGENSNLWKGGKTTLICEWCGQEHEVPQCRSDDARFCSQGCKGEWQSETRVGENAPHYKGGTYPYGSGWTAKKKREVRKEYGYKCAGCPMTQEEHIEKYGRRLEVHHISKARNVEDEEVRNSKDNLVPLCHKCHLSKWELMAPLRPQIIE